jgi:dolichyl-phosphate-mannose-protein mannosyltransferase
MFKLRPVVGLKLGFACLLGFALELRFWGLGWFNSLVFDEIHYVPFALNYLQQQPVFDAHPPLGKYLIAFSLVIGQNLAASFQWPMFRFEDLWLSALGYRLLNALVGATVPLLVAGLAWQLSSAYDYRRRGIFALLASGLMALEGLSLVESRFALINLYWLWFGLAGQLAWITARLAAIRGLHQSGKRPFCLPLHGWGLVAGIALGAAISVKWNGAGFWLGLVAVEILAWRWPGLRVIGSWQGTAFPWRTALIYLGFVPMVTYGLLWVPHLVINQVSLIGVHQQIWSFHQGLKSGADIHPYCSAWYTWPLMLRPVAYFYSVVNQTPGEDILAPTLPSGMTTYTVQAMGNPILWWLSTAAMVSLMGGQASRWLRRWQDPKAEILASSPVVLFVLVNYAANWLPWALVQRCTFLYHALGLVPFGVLALAWLLSRWLVEEIFLSRVMALMLMLAIILGFWFWLPVFIGLPLSPEALQHRWWLRSWI